MLQGGAWACFVGVILFVAAFQTLCWSLIFPGWAVMSFPFVMIGMIIPFIGAPFAKLAGTGNKGLFK